LQRIYDTIGGQPPSPLGTSPLNSYFFLSYTLLGASFSGVLRLTKSLPQNLAIGVPGVSGRLAVRVREPALFLNPLFSPASHAAAHIRGDDVLELLL
jgi:hypothetical protein